MMKKLSIFLLLVLGMAGPAEDILLWQVNDSATVDGTPIQDFLVQYPETDDAWSAVRVRLTLPNQSTSTILDINFGDGIWEDGYWGVWLGDTGNGWGAGVPTGNQSRTGYKTMSTIQEIIDSNGVTIDSGEVLEALFVMELGYNTWDDGVGDYLWTTLAETNPELYSELRSRYMYESSDVAPPVITPWTPIQFYTHPPVPEPSAVLLMLIGAGILGLKRHKYI